MDAEAGVLKEVFGTTELTRLYKYGEGKVYVIE